MSRDVKRSAIFNSAIKLLESTENQSDIKISDIAKNAGVGKGTVYEYFNSKDELLQLAVIYGIEQQFSQMENMRVDGGFRESFTFVMGNLDMKIVNSIIFSKALIFRKPAKGIDSLGESLFETATRLKKVVFNIFCILAKKAADEGVINPDYTDSDLYFIIGGILMVIVNYRHSFSPYSNLSNDELYSMLADKFVQFLR